MPIPGQSTKPIQRPSQPPKCSTKDHHFTTYQHANSPEHKQPAKQSSIPMSTMSTVNKTLSSMKPNNAKIIQKTLLSRPSTGITTEDSIIKINSKPVESENKYLMPMKPANHTGPQDNHFYHHHQHQQEYIVVSNCSQDHLIVPWTTHYRTIQFYDKQTMTHIPTPKYTIPSCCTRKTKTNHYKT